MGRAYSALGGPLLTQCGDTSLFPQEPSLTIGSGWEQGVSLEIGVSTTNNCSRSEPTVSQLNAKSATVLDGPGIGVFSASIQFQAVAQLDYAYLTPPIGISAPMLSIFVQMDDNSAPRIGTGASNDFSMVVSSDELGGVVTPTGTAGLYRCHASRTPATSSPTNSGIVRRATHSGKGFRVVGYQVESGAGRTIPSRYKPTSGSVVTETNYYYPNTGIIQCARSIDSALANGLSCSGSGVTWQVPPLLF